MFLAINSISLQKLLIHKNKKKNKRGFLFKISLSLSDFYKWCFEKVIKNSQKYANKCGKKTKS